MRFEKVSEYFRYCTYVEILHLLSQFVRELSVGRKVTCTRACRKENGQHYYIDK